MSIGGNGRCPNCGVVRPSHQFQPVRLVSGPGGVSDWLRCPACGFRAAKRRFTLPPQRKGTTTPQSRPKPRRAEGSGAGSTEAKQKPQAWKPRGIGALREELARVQSLVSQVSADIEGAHETGDQRALLRLMHLQRKLQADSFDLKVELTLTDDLPPAE